MNEDIDEVLADLCTRLNIGDVHEVRRLPITLSNLLFLQAITVRLEALENEQDSNKEA